MPLPKTHRDDSAAEANGTGRFGRSRRLRKPSEFAAVLAAPRPNGLRAAQYWLSMSAAWFPSEVPGVRFGATVGKRNVRRAVDRALVKRVVREAARRSAPALEASCARRQCRVDVAFRLKSPRDRAVDGHPVSCAAWRRALREEADALLRRLAERLAKLDE